MENKHLLQYCHYYKGEDENPMPPATPAYAFWNVEKFWVKFVMTDEIKQDNVALAFVIDFPDELDDISKDIPGYLKATLYNFYTNAGGDKKYFPDYLKEYLANAKF